jgi:SNF2 family DNA or RNA helicase
MELLPEYKLTTEGMEKIEKKMERFRYFIRNAELKSKTYQESGVKWCIYKEMCKRPENEKRGGFLSDEMGLGKTLTMIGTIFANYQKGRSTLIVVPVILINQWFHEILRTTGHKSIICHGRNKPEEIENAPIVLTSYGTVSSKRACLLEKSWFRIVFDEAHHLRNQNTNVHRTAKLLKSEIFWFVSGTPIQNKMADFKSLCSLMGLTDDLQEIIQTCVLKRTKKTAGIVISDAICETIPVIWDCKTEKMISDGFHESLSFRKTIETSESLNLSSERQLVNIIKSRQMCVLPSLVSTFMEKMNIPPEKSIIQMLPHYRSKINAVVNKLIKNVEFGKLIFCHFREEMNKIKEMLETSGITDVAIIDGRVSLKQRDEILKRHPKYLLLQIQTACEGLNLQEHYSEIYFVSPHWNPAIEQQAIARCHRIGQENQVRVFRFHMTEEEMTIEEWINIKQQKKLECYL